MPPGTTSEIAIDGESAAVSGTPNGGTANVISNGPDGVNAVAEAAAANSTTELATDGALAGGELHFPCTSFPSNATHSTVRVPLSTSAADRIVVLICICLVCPWCRRHYHQHCSTALCSGQSIAFTTLAPSSTLRERVARLLGLLGSCTVSCPTGGQA
jgi:hypothetical protein